MSGTRERLVSRLAAVNASLFGLGIALLVVATLGSKVKVAGTEIVAGTPTWIRATMGCFAFLMIVLASFGGPRVVRVLWSGGGFLGAEPRIAARFVHRPELAAKLLPALLMRNCPVALVGSSGAGKSVLAAWVCHNRRIRRHFRGGITWLDARANRDAVSLLNQLAYRLGIEHADFNTVEQARDYISAELRRRRMLIVLDNVIDREPLRAFTGLGAHCKILFTTRNRELARIIDASIISVAEFLPGEAMELLTRWAAAADDKSVPMATKLCERLSNWPLAIAMSGAMIAHGRTSRDVIELIDDDLGNVHAEIDYESGYPTLLAAVQVSIDELLDEVIKERYTELAIFSGRGPFPRSAAEALWKISGMSSAATGDVLAMLVARSLLTTVSGNRYTIHDLQYEVLSRKIDPARISKFHSRLIDGYAPSYPDGWFAAAGDPYLASNITAHLWLAGREAELGALLRDLRWIYTRLATDGLRELVADYAHCADPVAQAIRRALLLSAETLTADYRHVTSQLVGRLLGHPDIRVHSWAAGLDSPNGRPWLAPVAPALTPASGPLEQQLTGHGCAVCSLAVTPNGSRGLSGDMEGNIRLWDLQTGQELLILNGHKGEVCSVAIAADGRTAVSAGDDAVVQVWDLSSGASSAKLTSHGGGRSAVALCSVGRRGVSGDADGKIRVWDVETGRRWAALSGHNGAVCSVAVTADGQRAVSGGMDGTIRLWNLETHEELARLSGGKGAVRSVDITPDGHRVVSGGEDARVHIWDLTARRELISFRGHRSSIISVSISSDGRHVLSGAKDGSTYVWDCVTAQDGVALPSFGEGINAVAVTADGFHAASACSDGAVRIWNLEGSHQSAALTAHQDRVQSVAVTSDGLCGVSGGADGTVRVWNLESGLQTFSLEGHHGRVNAVSVVPGCRSAVSGGSDGTIRLWDLRNGELIACFEGNIKSVWAVLADRDSKYVIAGTSTGDAYVWNYASGALLHSYAGSGKAIVSLCGTVDTGVVVGGSDEGDIYRWDLRERVGQRLIHASRDRDTLIGNYAISFTPDGCYAVSGDKDGIIRVLDLRTRVEVNVIGGDGRLVQAIAISPDGRYVAHGNDQGMVRISNARTGDELASWRGDNPVSACAFIPEKQCAVTVGDAKGALYILELRNGNSCDNFT